MKDYADKSYLRRQLPEFSEIGDRIVFWCAVVAIAFIVSWVH